MCVMFVNLKTVAWECRPLARVAFGSGFMSPRPAVTTQWKVIPMYRTGTRPLIGHGYITVEKSGPHHEHVNEETYY